MLNHINISAGEMLVGDCFVSDEYHDETLWGQTVTRIDILDRTDHKMAVVRLTGGCGLALATTVPVEVLREDNTIVRATCSCGAHLVLAVTDPEPVGQIVVNPECPSCNERVEIICGQCNVKLADHPAGNGLDECPGDF